MTSLLELLAFYIGFSYILGPILIRFTMKTAANASFDPIQADILSPANWEYMQATAGQLADLGFAEPAYFTMQGHTTNTALYGILMVNRPQGDKALVTVIFGLSNGLVHSSTAHCEFSTRFESGQVFDTSNSKTLGSYKRAADDIKTKLPNVRDPRLLHDIHQYRMAKLSRGGPKVLYPEGEALTWLASAMRKSSEEQVAFGRLYLDTRADAFRPTWAGACLMTWGLVFPVKSIRDMIMNNKAKALLTEYQRSH